MLTLLLFQTSIAKFYLQNRKLPVGLFCAILLALYTTTPLLAQFEIATQMLPISDIQTTAGGDGAAVSFYDFNKDGWDDLSFSTGNGEMFFFVNNNGNGFTFAPFSIPNENNGYVYALLWADYDNDGDLDILVGKRPGRLELWQNNGNMEFTEVGIEVGFEPTIHSYSFAAWADYDHDGCLDLFVAKNYITDLGNHSNSSVLYRSTCDGQFEIVTEEAGVLLEPSAVFQPVFADVNGDGWEDLFIAVDRFDWSNELFINNQDGTFSKTTATSGVEDYFCSMSSSVADFDQDGDLDIYVTNNPNQEGNILYLNDGDAKFSNVGHEMGVDAYLTSWSGMWIDYNNNSWQDLLLCVGPHPIPPTPNQFYINQNGENFQENAEGVGLGIEPWHSQTAAKGDFDNDGFYDMFINNQSPHKNQFITNQGGSGNYISIELEGTLANIAGVGTWIRCYAGGKETVQYTLCGENHGGQNSSRIIFGLAEVQQVDSLVLEWNVGTREVYYTPEINQHHHLVEGASFTLPFAVEITGDTLLCPGETATLDAGLFEHYYWSTGDTTQTIIVNQSGTYWVETENQFGLTATSFPVSITVAPIAEIDISVNHLACAGDQNAVIDLTVSNGVPDTVIWNNGSTGTHLDSLLSGVYSFGGTDVYGCPIQGAVSINEPPPIMGQVSINPTNCYGDSTGRAFLEIIGGTPPLSTHWQGQNPDSLAAGSYQVIVTDTNGCSWFANYTITQPDSMAVLLDITDDTNGENNGAVSAEISGGSSPYSVVWSNGTTDELSLSDLSPGNYNLEVTDSHNCTETFYFTVETNTGLAEHNKSPISIIVPNPASDYFTLQGCTIRGKFDITLVNTLGKLMLAVDEIECGQSISLHSLPNGTYLVILKQEHLRQIGRLVILR